ncbi:uracil phosphoribosyltransferase [Polyangium sp. 15x6]|nr:uracil phosphoribosyltransferase [Polyangium sp. 15x6]
MMVDTAYAESRYRAAEIPHRYGPGVHLIDDPFAWTLLTRACSPDTGQPDMGRLVRMLYEGLARIVLATEFPRARVDVPTRMAVSHPQAVYRGTALSRTTKAVTVGIARAGTMPSQVVFDLMNEVLDPNLVRQDHLFMSRQTNAQGEVVGATWHDAKIGRDVGDRYVLFPDPMGATGSSMVSAVSYYKNSLEGTPAKLIAMHLIVTPEYIRRVHAEHPDLAVYAYRLDRGLSPPAVLRTEPGTSEEERGLNEVQYIVPGAGGVGEILNNAWV